MNDPETKIWIEMDGLRYKFENEAWSSNDRHSEGGVKLLNRITDPAMRHDMAIDCVKKVLARAGLTEAAIKEIHRDGEIEDDVSFDDM